MRQNVLLPLMIAAAASAPAHSEDVIKLTTKTVDPHTCAVMPHLLTADRNSVYFPMPSLTVGAALREGAVGTTKDELERLLGFSATDAHSLKTLAEHLATREGFTYRYASAAFLPPQATVLPEYLGYIREVHGAEVRPVDSGDAESIGAMNRWFFENSGVEGVISSGELPANSEVVVASACKLQTTWRSWLATSDGTFYVDDKVVPSLFCVGDYSGLRRSSFAGYEVLIIPLEGAARLWVVRGRTSADVPKIAQAFADQGFAGFGPITLVQGSPLLRLPEFNTSFDQDLVELFKKLGVNSSFDTRADFSRMTGQKVAIAKIQLKARLTLDRQGIRGGQVVYAAAATLGGGPSEEPTAKTVISIDRPFVGLLTDSSSGVVMTLFSVVDPTQNN